MRRPVHGGIVDKFLTFTVVGLSTSAIYAVIASGLVLTYTTTGIFNFSHGAIGMLAAFAYWQLRVDWGWPTPLALLVVIAVLAPLFGVFLETVVMRGLEGTSEATRLVVSISLLAALIALANWIWNPAVGRTLTPFLQDVKPVHIFSTTVTWHQIVTMLVAIAVAFALRFLLFQTRIGISMRASVDDRSLATLNGARPDRISMLAWAAGCVLAAIGGILIAPGGGLNSTLLSLLIVNAYAAAIFGRLRSLPLTFLGAVVIGLTEGYLAGYTPKSEYLSGLRVASPVILLFIALLVIPNPRLRGRTRSREWYPTPSWSGALTYAGLVAFAGVVMATTLSASDLTVYGRIFPFAIFALSLVPLIGFGGQISLCQLSFAGIGAVVWANYGGSGNPVWLLVAALASAAVGALIALPALRLSGIYLALATAAFAVALDRWVWTLNNFEVFGLFRVRLFGGGSATAVPLSIFGYSFDTPARQIVLLAGALGLLSVAVVAIRRSSFGRRLLAMKDSEAAVATLGMRLLVAKTAVFALSAAIAGFGGALYATQLGSLQPANFDFVTGLPVFMLAIIGGIGFVGSGFFTGASLQGFLPLVSTLGTFFTRLAGVLPGLAGIGLGRKPNGAISQMREAFMPAWRDKRIIGAIAAGIVGVWLLRIGDVIANWPFVLLACGWSLALLLVAAARGRNATAPRVEGVSLEWLGVTEPWNEEQLREIDRALGVNELDLHDVA